MLYTCVNLHISQHIWLIKNRDMFTHCCALSDNHQTRMLLRKVFLQDLWPQWLCVPHSTLLLIRVPYGSIRRIWLEYWTWLVF